MTGPQRQWPMIEQYKQQLQSEVDESLARVGCHHVREGEKRLGIVGTDEVE